MTVKWFNCLPNDERTAGDHPSLVRATLLACLFWQRGELQTAVTSDLPPSDALPRAERRPTVDGTTLGGIGTSNVESNEKQIVEK